MPGRDAPATNRTRSCRRGSRRKGDATGQLADGLGRLDDEGADVGAGRGPDGDGGGDDLDLDAAGDEGADGGWRDGRGQEVVVRDVAPAAGLAVGRVAGEGPVAAAGLIVTARGTDDLDAIALAGQEAGRIVEALRAVEEAATHARVAVCRPCHQVAAHQAVPHTPRVGQRRDQIRDIFV